MNVAELAKEYNYNDRATINGYNLNNIILLLQNYKDRLDLLNIV